MSKYIQPEIVEAIIRKADIYEVVSDFIPLKKKGVNYWGLSPFSKERTPSFAVNQAKNIFKCFSSGKGGNCATFLIEVEGYSFIEAIEHLSKKYGIAIPEVEQEKNENEEVVYRCLSMANNHFVSNKKDAKFIEFITNRGLTTEIANEFQLGLSLDTWDALKNFLTLSHFEENTAIEVGLLNSSKGRVYDTYRNRVMFPIHSSLGRIVGFGGRCIEGNEAKYINSKQTSVFDKGENLYGIYQAKNAIRKEGFAYLTEGFMDVVSMHQYGIKNTVATLGTSLTAGQAKLIRRFTTHVVLIYDGDAPGIKAANKAIDILLSEGLTVDIIVLPNNEDPDSILKNGGAETFHAVAKLTFIEFKVKYKLGETTTENKKAIQEIAKSISLVNDSVMEQLLSKEAAKMLDIEYSSIWEMVTKDRKPSPNAIDFAHLNTSEKAIKEIEISEHIIIDFMLKYGNRIIYIEETMKTKTVSEHIIDSLSAFPFFDATLKIIFSELRESNFDSLVNHPNQNVSMLIVSIDMISQRLNFLNTLDLFDSQIEIQSITDRLIETYIIEWKKEMYSLSIQNIENNSEIALYLQLLEPLHEFVCGINTLSKYEIKNEHNA